MEIRPRTKRGIVILDLAGRIDADSAVLIETISQCLHDGYCDILCNLEAVDFMDYLGISAIVIAYKEVTNNKGRMKFVNIPSHLRQFFAVSGLERVIEIYAREDLALKSFKEDRVIENIKKMQMRRRFKRLTLDIKIEIKPKHVTKAHCTEVELLDLSAVGAYIYGCRKFKLGDEVILKIDLPSEGRTFNLDARVVWLSDKDVQHHIHPGMGVEFRDIPSDIQHRLVKFIEKNLSFA